ncbi:hypothetical protein K458DRAFT_485087 [Lentithecium fluviatile CBS 122367]|uniref:Uncharacterized protein n=1 Tax=Lentithecium fluviatile CBS 122367 TaxID=1168545 RepID=A0A6G1JBK1_9PLEO|nr:hypothetical protein K458DRAFT_485087 [Lentithecium fluviatile CBS 122367]
MSQTAPSRLVLLCDLRDVVHSHLSRDAPSPGRGEASSPRRRSEIADEPRAQLTTLAPSASASTVTVPAPVQHRRVNVACAAVRVLVWRRRCSVHSRLGAPEAEAPAVSSLCCAASIYHRMKEVVVAVGDAAVLLSPALSAGQNPSRLRSKALPALHVQGGMKAGSRDFQLPVFRASEWGAIENVVGVVELHLELSSVGQRKFDFVDPSQLRKECAWSATSTCPPDSTGQANLLCRRWMSICSWENFDKRVE